MMKQRHHQQQPQQKSARKTIMNNNNNNNNDNQQQQQQDSSDGYVMNPYAEFGGNSSSDPRSWQQQQQQQHHGDDYRHFDPYSIYSEEEDVWYSEERLFEDHLEEIFNKWRLLDDDIWCKLIIMERNRRIGKAYARVPIVTIDGSHELSYDGYKLALNGFDNPDRDLKTEECRKRIGKGIRIKMDNFGNILIKRLSKSGVYIKEWIQAPGGDSLPPTTGANHPPSTDGASGVAASKQGKLDAVRVMPSRQQLIKNQNAMLNGAGGGSSTNSSLGSSQSSGSLDQHHKQQQPLSGSGSGSLMTSSNDSAICDEVLNVGGRLDQDKIYVLFDMKKFQANITQELCRPYPDKRKLEQQCFSIIGLARDSEEILNLPCWVMVINIVAIEVLNERFPDLMLPREQAGGYGGVPTKSQSSQRLPNFVSIFDQTAATAAAARARGGKMSKEEDPYSLPANESSSDMKSSIHNGGDYGGARSRYYGPGAGRADMYKRSQLDHAGAVPPMRHKSRSNSNIYGVGLGGKLQPPAQQHQQPSRGLAGNRYNNSTSIYSPGHMLVLPTNDSVPPELPPRDFVSRKVTKTKSALAISGALATEEIYSTGGLAEHPAQMTSSIINTKVRKTKRNRFLESLKAPLEMAVKSSSSRSSASVLGSSPGGGNTTALVSAESEKSPKKKSVEANNKSKSSSIVKSFLARSNKQQQQKDNSSDDNNKKILAAEKTQRLIRADSGEADSVVDSAEELADEPLMSSHEQIASSPSTSSSYNDLDIPTPDYETDENIYALNETASYAAFSSIAAAAAGDDNLNVSSKQAEKVVKKSSTTTAKKNIAASQSAAQQQKSSNNSTSNNNNSGNNSNKTSKQNNSSKTAHNKDDLYYSGFRAHVPSNINGLQQQQQQQAPRTGRPLTNNKANGNSNSNGIGSGKTASLMDGPIGAADGNGRLMKARNSRYASHLSGPKMALAGQTKMSGRDMMIYGSTTGLSAAASVAGGASGAGSRYRSASVQRYYSRNQAPHAHPASMYSDFYDPGPEDPYGGSHYGVALQARRRSNSKCLPAGPSPYGDGGCQVSSAASGYDIGRSSSGIYGNNSNSSSSSDYTDWHPHMRKVNSSGYLNSIFKSHHLHQQQQHESPYGASMNTHGQPNVGLGAQKTIKAAHGYPANNTADSQGFVQGSRTLAPSSSRSTLVLSKQQQLQQQSHGQNQLAQKLPNGGPAYRSYDSSNDSEPSYTNSSDGLDIYDHIGAAQANTARLANNGKLHRNNNNHLLHQRQFLDTQPIAHNHLAPEVHVGEWENMYDR